VGIFLAKRSAKFFCEAEAQIFQSNKVRIILDCSGYLISHMSA